MPAGHPNWGGVRPRSGPKPKTAAAKNNAARTPVPAEAKTQPARVVISADTLQVLQDMMRDGQLRARERPRSEDWNPYIIRQDTHFGPVGIKVPKRKRMAMDEAIATTNQYAVQAWQAGGLLNNVVSEGLLFMGYPYLSELAQRPEFRLICEIHAEEMTRKFTRFRGVQDKSTKGEASKRNQDDVDAEQRRKQTDAKPRSDPRNKELEAKIKELNDFVEQLQVRSWFKDVFAQDGFFGIGHLYMDLKGANADNPRDPENMNSIGNGRDAITEAKFKGKKNFLRGLRTIEPIWCYPTVYNAANPLVKTWYDPQVWYVMGAEIHKTRLLPFISRPVPDILKPAYAFGGMSRSQMAQPYIDIWLRIRSSVGEIVNAYSVMVLFTNLATTTQPGGSGGGDGDVLARAGLFNMLRDNMGVQVIDKITEDFKNVSVPLSGLDDLQAQAQEHCAAIARLPLVKYTGIQPKGLNATSEGELRAFEETIAGEQEHFRPQVTTVYDFAQISLWGARDPDITTDFIELREETPKEKSEIRKLEAETDQIRIDSGVVWQEEARRKLAADAESGYASIEVEDVPDLLEEEEEGLEPEGGRPQPQAEKGEEEQGEDAGVTPNFDDGTTAEERRRNAEVPAGAADQGGHRRGKRK